MTLQSGEQWLERPLGRTAFLAAHLPLCALLAQWLAAPASAQRRWLLVRVGAVGVGLAWALARRRWSNAAWRGVPEALLLLGLGLMIGLAVSPDAARALGAWLALTCWLGLLPPERQPARPGWAVLWQWPMAATVLAWSVVLAWQTWHTA
jgi:hypothetical protein